MNKVVVRPAVYLTQGFKLVREIDLHTEVQRFVKGVVYFAVDVLQTILLDVLALMQILTFIDNFDQDVYLLILRTLFLHTFE